MRTSRLRLAAWAGATVVAAACEAAAPIPVFDDTPSLAVVITPELPPPCCGPTPDSGLYALFTTTGSPLRSEFLRADRFEMRRLSDGARFAWRAVDPPTQVITVPIAFMGRGNYFLPRRSDASGLGSDSIASGEAYEIVAEVGPDRVVGRTRVPGRIEFVRAPSDGDSIVRWRRVPGAARYSVTGQVVFGEIAQIEDTAFVFRRPFVIPGETPDSIVIRVFALDTNYAAFTGDLGGSQAGVSGGRGVVGSYSWGAVQLRPPPATSAAPR